MIQALVDVKEIILQVNGRERKLSERELSAIIEQCWTLKPTEGKLFEVNPMEIDQTIFQKKRNNSKQEETRKMILEAFQEIKRNPTKYAKTFKTLIPKKRWNMKTVAELEELAKDMGDHIANWVEQALEWAQRIDNGESWDSICNAPDTSKWFRLVIGKNGIRWIVGGSSELDCVYPASEVVDYGIESCDGFVGLVPSIVFYD